MCPKELYSWIELQNLATKNIGPVKFKLFLIAQKYEIKKNTAKDFHVNIHVHLNVHMPRQLKIIQI